MLLDHPTRIADINLSKPGKHGAAKVYFVGVDLFTNKKY
jgi:translation elongation factor P/translation initiation factor 5A